MRGNFTKLYNGILDSTLWINEPDQTRLAWITMLSSCDEFGRVIGSVPGLAHRAVISIEAARTAIKSFLSPDPDSRTKDFDGRRIEEIDGGWRVLNYTKYRDMRSDANRQEQNRLAQQRAREKAKAVKASADSSAPVSTHQHESAESAQAEAEAERDLSSSSSMKTPRRRKAAEVPACPHDKIRELFREVLPELPQPVIADARGRKKATTTFWRWILTSTKPNGTRRAETAEGALAWIRDYLERVRLNDFLMGRSPRGEGHEQWECTFDYLLTERGIRKVIEQTKVAE